MKCSTGSLETLDARKVQPTRCYEILKVRTQRPFRRVDEDSEVLRRQAVLGPFSDLQFPRFESQGPVILYLTLNCEVVQNGQTFKERGKLRCKTRLLTSSIHR